MGLAFAEYEIRSKWSPHMVSDREFNAIFEAYHPRILRYLTRIAGPDEAEDLAQEVFDKISRGLEGFHEKSKLSTWIYRIATHTAIDRSRAAASRHAKEHRPFVEETPSEASASPAAPAVPVADRLVIRKEMSDCVNEFIDNLPPDYRMVIVLSDLEGFANKEIAQILGISLDNVKIRLHRGRSRLKKALQEGCEFYYTKENTLACDRRQISILPKKPQY